MAEISRRHLLATGAGAAVGAASGLIVLPGKSLAAVPALPSTPFALSVASGDPWPTSVVLWTRLCCKPTTVGYGLEGQPDVMRVHWRIAHTTADLASDAASVDYGTADALPVNARAVHVIADNLAPGTSYVYQFYYTEPNGKRWSSPVGHTRTRPADTSTTPARFAVSSCQNVGHQQESDGTYKAWRYFNGWGYLNNNVDVDFVVQVGDYIYGDPRIGDGTYEGTCDGLRKYRLRYGRYRTRSSLERIHRTTPFYSAPDDHEWWNNVHGGTSGLDGRTVSHFNAAVRTYWEHMPLRYKPVKQSDGRLKIQLHRHVSWGTVLDLFLTDTRQHRTQPGTGTGATLLGAAQRDWLLDRMHNSTRTWTAIATQVPMANVVNKTDKWVGYPYERGLVTSALGSPRANGQPPNAVVLSGDIHAGAVAKVNKQGTGTFVATEFVAPAMSSSAGAGPSVNETVQRVFRYNGTAENGILVCQVSPAEWRATYYLGHDVLNPQGAVREGPTFSLAPGQVGI